MFDRKTVNAYKSISPPDKMKENILRMYEEHRKPSFYSRLQAISAIAACFLVVFTVVVLYFGNNTPLTITYHGDKVSKTPMAVTFEDIPYSSNSQSNSMPRTRTVPNSIALDFATDEQTEIAVSSGTLLLYDNELNNTFYAGESCVIDSPTLVYWSIDGFSETDVSTLRLVTNGKTTKLSLTYDTNSETWMLAYVDD